MPPPMHLPPAEQHRLTLGYMRLTDSAPLIVARERGLFDDYGLDVTLQREVSWANLRDRLVAGSLDAAQLLAPLPFATGLGAGGLRAHLITGLSLGMNGNAITLSNSLWDRLSLPMPDEGKAPDPVAIANTLAEGIRHGRVRDTVTLATVHAFSMHSFLLRLWLKAGGLDPDHDVRLIVLPPEQMCDSLARGVIDGFCVGEPWSTVAVEQGIGSVAASGYQIWNNAPEKVLGVTGRWHQQHPATHLRLRLAIMEACRLLDEPRHRESAAALLSKQQFLDLPEKVLLPSLTGNYRFHKHSTAVYVPSFHVFWRWQACFPWRSHADWMTRQCSALYGKPTDDEQRLALVQQCYRPELYREAARVLGIATPVKDSKPENRHDTEWLLSNGITLGPDLMLSGANSTIAVQTP